MDSRVIGGLLPQRSFSEAEYTAFAESPQPIVAIRRRQGARYSARRRGTGGTAMDFGLTEEQELDHMKDFNELYRGKRTIEEELRLRFQAICREHEALRPRWQGIPTQTISGKRGDGRFAFFCYAIPGLRLINGESGDDEVWTLEDGESRWYLYDFADDTVTEETIEMMDIHDIIECEPSEERVMNIGEDGLSAARHNIEEHIFNTILKQLKVPMGHEPELRCWMSIG